MGNLFSYSNKSKSSNPRYELLISSEHVLEKNSANQYIDAEIRLLRLDLSQQVEARERLEIRIAKLNEQQNNMHNAIHNVNEKLSEKINIISNNMENLLNNDKILLDKLIEKNIVSTIEEKILEV